MTAVGGKTVPLSYVSTAFAGKTVPFIAVLRPLHLPCVSMAFAACFAAETMHFLVVLLQLPNVRDSRRRAELRAGPGCDALATAACRHRPALLVRWGQVRRRHAVRTIPATSYRSCDSIHLPQADSREIVGLLRIVAAGSSDRTPQYVAPAPVDVGSDDGGGAGKKTAIDFHCISLCFHCLPVPKTVNLLNRALAGVDWPGQTVRAAVHDLGRQGAC